MTDLSQLKIYELKSLAKERGLTLPRTSTRDDIIKALNSLDSGYVDAVVESPASAVVGDAKTNVEVLKSFSAPVSGLDAGTNTRQEDVQKLLSRFAGKLILAFDDDGVTMRRGILEDWVSFRADDVDILTAARRVAQNESHAPEVDNG